jgi:SAM-dependent methyltransferase
MSVTTQLIWSDEGFALRDHDYRIQQPGEPSTAADAFVFYKTRDQLEQFDRFFAETGFAPRRVLELGIWDGGSAAFWVDALGLERYAAIDLQTRGDSPYFQAWQAARDSELASTHWGVDQTDSETLTGLITARGLEPLDLVLDDCSHHYAPTLRSFELLFGRVRPGGYYVIEDWAWALQPQFQDPRHPWRRFAALHPITHRLLDLHGSRPDLISALHVYPDFIAVERGGAVIDTLDVGRATTRRPGEFTRQARRRLRWLRHPRG